MEEALDLSFGQITDDDDTYRLFFLIFTDCICVMIKCETVLLQKQLILRVLDHCYRQFVCSLDVWVAPSATPHVPLHVYNLLVAVYTHCTPG